MIKNFLKNHKIHTKIVPFFDLFFLFRPIGFFVVWVMLCIGMYLASFFPSSFFRENELFITNINFQTVLLFLGMSLLSSAICIINQIADKKSDGINKKLFLLNSKFSIEFAAKTKNILLVISFFIFLFLNWTILFVAFLIFIFSGYLYNQKPYELKKKPFLGLLCNIILGFLLSYVGFIHLVPFNFDFSLKFATLLLPYLISFSAVCILSDIPDIKGDKEDGRNSFVVYFGRKRTIILSTFLVFLSLILAILLEDPLSSTSIIVSFPFFLYALIRGLHKDVIRAIRYPIAILNLFSMVIYPYLFLGILFIFYFSKYYYWHRFNLHYPTMLVDD